MLRSHTFSEIVNSREVADATAEPVKSGYDKLDAIVDGITKPELFVIGSRPGIGKSTFALNICRNILSTAQIPIAYFTLEYLPGHLVDRLIRLDKGLFNSKTNLPLHIIGANGCTVDEITASALKLIGSDGIGLIIIDAFQMIEPANLDSSRDHSHRCGCVARRLKNFALDNHVTVIMTSQVSSDCECRWNKRPILSDLNKYGHLDEYADSEFVFYLFWTVVF
jgi:replicative DNA helicase